MRLLARTEGIFAETAGGVTIATLQTARGRGRDPARRARRRLHHRSRAEDARSGVADVRPDRDDRADARRVPRSVRHRGATSERHRSDPHAAAQPLGQRGRGAGRGGDGRRGAEGARRRSTPASASASSTTPARCGASSTCSSPTRTSASCRVSTRPSPTAQTSCPSSPPSPAASEWARARRSRPSGWSCGRFAKPTSTRTPRCCRRPRCARRCISPTTSAARRRGSRWRCGSGSGSCAAPGSGRSRSERPATFVGRAGSHWPSAPTGPGIEIGWTLHPDHWGKGYATEAGAAARRLRVRAPRRRRDLQLHPRTRTLASQAVARRLGFTLWEERTFAHFPDDAARHLAPAALGQRADDVERFGDRRGHDGARRSRSSPSPRRRRVSTTVASRPGHQLRGRDQRDRVVRDFEPLAHARDGDRPDRRVGERDRRRVGDLVLRTGDRVAVRARRGSPSSSTSFSSTSDGDRVLPARGLARAPSPTRGR